MNRCAYYMFVLAAFINISLFYSTQFVEAIRLNRKPFHMVGTSMGGTVAGVYAACHPSDLYSLTLICPVGWSIYFVFDTECIDIT